MPKNIKKCLNIVIIKNHSVPLSFGAQKTFG